MLASAARTGLCCASRIECASNVSPHAAQEMRGVWRGVTCAATWCTVGLIAAIDVLSLMPTNTPPPTPLLPKSSRTPSPSHQQAQLWRSYCTHDDIHQSRTATNTLVTDRVGCSVGVLPKAGFLRPGGGTREAAATRPLTLSSTATSRGVKPWASVTCTWREVCGVRRAVDVATHVWGSCWETERYFRLPLTYLCTCPGAKQQLHSSDAAGCSSRVKHSARTPSGWDAISGQWAR